MNKDKLMSQAVFALFHASVEGRDPELEAALKELDSIENLNNNPLALRSAGLKAARFAYVMGALWGMSHNKN